jgi:hypothetical protein
MMMRRRLGVLAGTAGLVLAASIATAGAAEARNVGGSVPTGADCVQPGGVVLAEQSMAPCICYSVAGVGVVSAVGRGGDCPKGVDRVKIDRNVGG